MFVEHVQTYWTRGTQNAEKRLGLREDCVETHTGRLRWKRVERAQSQKRADETTKSREKEREKERFAIKTTYLVLLHLLLLLFFNSASKLFSAFKSDDNVSFAQESAQSLPPWPSNTRQEENSHELKFFHSFRLPSSFEISSDRDDGWSIAFETHQRVRCAKLKVFTFLNLFWTWQKRTCG